MDAPEPLVRETLEYGISAADFERIVPRLVPGLSPTQAGRAFVFDYPGGGRVTVSQGPERERRIAQLRLPCLDLTFEFRDLTPHQREQFRARFARAFQKGGG